MSGSRLNFGSYTLLGQLGRGPIGEVYRATASEDTSTIALKLLYPPFSRQDGFRSRLFERLEAAKSINHNNVVKILTWGEFNQTLFIASELHDGICLRDLLAHVRAQGGVIPPSIAVGLVLQLCEALRAVHEVSWAGRGLVHGNVKPSNILINRRGVARLLDMGGMSTVGASEGDLWWLLPEGLPYMPPESLTSGGLEPQFDVYSLGAVLLELLTLAPPIEVDGFLQTLKRMEAPDVLATRARLKRFNFGRELIDLVEWALDPDPHRRLEDAACFVDYLADLVPSIPMGVAPEVFWGELFAEYLASRDESPADRKGPWDLMVAQGVVTTLETPEAMQKGEVIFSDGAGVEAVISGPTWVPPSLLSLLKVPEVEDTAPGETLPELPTADIPTFTGYGDEPPGDGAATTALNPSADGRRAVWQAEEAVVVMGEDIAYESDDVDDDGEFEEDDEYEDESEAFVASEAAEEPVAFAVGEPDEDYEAGDYDDDEEYEDDDDEYEDDEDEAAPAVIALGNTPAEVPDDVAFSASEEAFFAVGDGSDDDEDDDDEYEDDDEEYEDDEDEAAPVAVIEGEGEQVFSEAVDSNMAAATAVAVGDDYEDDDEEYEDDDEDDAFVDAEDGAAVALGVGEKVDLSRILSLNSNPEPEANQEVMEIAVGPEEDGVEVVATGEFPVEEAESVEQTDASREPSTESLGEQDGGVIFEQPTVILPGPGEAIAEVPEGVEKDEPTVILEENATVRIERPDYLKPKTEIAPSNTAELPRSALSSLQSLNGEAVPVGMDEMLEAFGAQKAALHEPTDDDIKRQVEHLRSQLGTGGRRKRYGPLPEGTIVEGQVKIIRRVEVEPARALYEAVPAPEAITRRCWECGYAHNTRDDLRCYRCQQPLTSKRFALSARWDKRLIALELELANKRLRHEHVGRIYTWMVHDGQICRLLEPRGEQLLAVRSADMAYSLILQVANDLCAALVYLGAQGIALKELLPSQVILKDGRASAYDFEVAAVEAGPLKAEQDRRNCALLGMLLVGHTTPEAEALNGVLSQAARSQFESAADFQAALKAVEPT